jgi:hypothetical protein
MIAYNNAKKFFEGSEVMFTSTPEEFNKDNVVKYMCSNGHESSLKRTTFANKRKTTDPNAFCAKCSTETDDEMITRYNEKLTNGHIITKILDRAKREVAFICGNCGGEGKSNFSSLERNIGFCRACEHQASAKTDESIKERIESLGMKLNSKYPFEYKNRDSLIHVLCRCGNAYETSARMLDRGSHCNTCKPDKIKETFQGKYGVDNVFQLEETKEKSKNTNLEKRGVQYPQQSEEVVKKTQATNMEKYGVMYYFNKPEVYQKIRDVCTEKYGKPFPLQVDEILKTCLENSKKACLEKYGVPYVLQYKDICDQVREKGKEACFEKYGTSYALQDKDVCKRVREKAKEACMKKYGVPYPLLNEEIFRKAMASIGQRKPFMLGDTCVYVMGYEPQMLRRMIGMYEPELGRVVCASDILVGKATRTYRYKTDDGVDHLYYPDIELKETNLTIEVKSIWTFNIAPRKTWLKMQAVVAEGRTARLVIFESGSKVYDTWTFDMFGVRSERDRTRSVFDQPIDFITKEIEAEVVAEEIVVEQLEELLE